MATRKLTDQELKQMNMIIRPKLGYAMQVTSGTYEDGKYHLVIGDPVNTVSQENLMKIGEILKKDWDSSVDYYHYGTKIA